MKQNFTISKFLMILFFITLINYSYTLNKQSNQKVVDNFKNNTISDNDENNNKSILKQNDTNVDNNKNGTNLLEETNSKFNNNNTTDNNNDTNTNTNTNNRILLKNNTESNSNTNDTNSRLSQTNETVSNTTTVSNNRINQDNNETDSNTTVSNNRINQDNNTNTNNNNKTSIKSSKKTVEENPLLAENFIENSEDMDNFSDNELSFKQHTNKEEWKGLDIHKESINNNKLVGKALKFRKMTVFNEIKKLKDNDTNNNTKIAIKNTNSTENNTKVIQASNTTENNTKVIQTTNNNDNNNNSTNTDNNTVKSLRTNTKEDKVYEQVTFVKELSPVGKLLNKEDKDETFDRLKDIGFESPSILTPMIDQTPTNVQVGYGINGVTNSPLQNDSQMWGNVESIKYNNLQNPSIVQRPTYSNNPFGGVNVKAPYNNSLQITSFVPQVVSTPFSNSSSNRFLR